jgi:transposase-like protein
MPYFLPNMSLTCLTSAQFKTIIKLLEEKEAVQAELSRIDSELAALQGGKVPMPGKAAPGRKAKAAGKRAKRGKMKAAIIGLLQGAGTGGITVQEVAQKLGVKPARVYVWLGATGKKLKEIKKLAPGKYAWLAGPTMVPKPVAPAKPGKAAAGRRAKMKDVIVDLVKASGQAGITIQAITQKLGVKAENIRVWFGTTGKKVKEIKRIGRGKYAWVD